MTRGLIGALAAAAVSGCALMSPAETEVTTAVLQKMPADLPHGQARPVSVLVFSPEATPAYNTTKMAYAVRPYEVAYFSRHQWSETPSQMLQPLLVRALQSTGYFSAVLTPPFAGSYTYALRTDIVELSQDFTSQPPALRLSLRLRLTDDAGKKVVATREISLREPMQQKTPYAGVVAANEATAKALHEVARFVRDHAN